MPTPKWYPKWTPKSLNSDVYFHYFFATHLDPISMILSPKWTPKWSPTKVTFSQTSDLAKVYQLIAKYNYSWSWRGYLFEVNLWTPIQNTLSSKFGPLLRSMWVPFGLTFATLVSTSFSDPHLNSFRNPPALRPARFFCSLPPNP